MWYNLLLVLLLQSSLADITEAVSRIAKPGCKDSCGEGVSIPYPFGIGPKCYHNPWFDVECTKDSKFKLKALNVSLNLQGFDPEYVNPLGRRINWSGGERSLTMEYDCQGFCADANNPSGSGPVYPTDLRNSPFRYSSKSNVLLVAGCGGDVLLKNSRNETLTGCAQVCRNGSEKFEIKHCYGIGCCQTTFPSSLDYFWLDFLVRPGVQENHKTEICSWSTNAVLVDNSWIANKVIDPHLSQLDCPVPAVLEWAVTDLPVNSPSYANSTCVYKKSSRDGGPEGYDCYCKSEFYRGNPYLPNGCQVIEECEGCAEDCVSLASLTYGCRNETNQRYEEAEANILKEKAGLILGLGIGLSMILLLSLFGAYWIHRSVKRRRDIRLKGQNFERNGGRILKQQLSSEDSDTDKARIFTSGELEKATDQFNENRILGHGGQGTVYKGMLCDGKIVAIKKFKLVDATQVNDFINEVMLLSQINHRNIVKLLGCCLETEVPLLVYEYVPNGTLSEHIRSPEDLPFTWGMRLQIAIDIANALAYLHSSSSLPIFHRDIKASNILLDSKYRAKLSDFGISKSVAIDQTHVTTRVVGTFGYLDPEYFQSRQFTGKSDVYSFGVVLVELLTGQIADFSTKDDRGLVPWFTAHVETSSLNDILDAQVLRESGRGGITAVADLARRCLILDGRRRPTMKDVEAELQTIRSVQGGWVTELSAITSTKDASQNSMTDTEFRRLKRGGTC